MYVHILLIFSYQLKLNIEYLVFCFRSSFDFLLLLSMTLHFLFMYVASHWFPYVKKRIVVIHQEQFELSPIQVINFVLFIPSSLKQRIQVVLVILSLVRLGKYV